MMGHASLVTGGESFPTCTPPRPLPPKGTLDDLVVRLEENGQYIPAKRIRTCKGTDLKQSGHGSEMAKVSVLDVRWYRSWWDSKRDQVRKPCAVCES